MSARHDNRITPAYRREMNRRLRIAGWVGLLLTQIDRQCINGHLTHTEAECFVDAVAGAAQKVLRLERKPGAWRRK
jgi:hypothetical protein